MSDRIETAAELFAALRSPNLKLRLGAIGGLARDPAAGLALGMHGDKDLIDVLVETIRREPLSSAITIALVRILAAFADSRVLAFLEEGLASWPVFDRLEVAARYVAATPRGLRCLEPMLWDLSRPHHAQAAARALRERNLPLDPTSALRAVLLHGTHAADPTSDSIDAWLVELKGPLARRALAEVECVRPHALLARWSDLPSGARVAILESLRRLDVSATLPILPDAIASGDRAVVAAALACLAPLGPAADGVRPPLSRFLAMADPLLAAAGIAVAVLDVDIALALAPDRPTIVRCAALRRVNGDRSRVVAALHDPAWEVRAVATLLLGAAGAEVVPLVEPLLGHPDEAVHLAAAQVLTTIGDRQAQISAISKIVTREASSDRM